MRHAIPYAFALTFSLLIQGCASTPTPISKSNPPPKNRVYASPIVSSSAPARVVIIKDEGAWASFGYHQIFLNGKVIASLSTGEKLDLTLDPGDYVFGVLPTASPETTKESVLGYAIYSMDQVLQAKKIYYYRVLVDGDNSSRIQRFVPSGEM